MNAVIEPQRPDRRLAADDAAAPWQPPRGLRRVEVFLVRPTKYDDQGYLLRHWRSVLPSNTLATLHALTEEAARRGALAPLQLRAHLCDESVQPLPERRILRLARRRDTRVVICLVGVQTSQFPRAADLARRFARRGIAVLIGGFHVSGALAFTEVLPAHLRALVDEGVTLVKGEVEATWADLLRAAAAGSLAAVYDSSADKPDLATAPLPRLQPDLMKHFVYRHFGTVDTSRGCPFTCRFCTIINVQGRTMRARDSAALATAIEANYRATGTHHYFFTDDDFARSPNWRAVLGELIRLRETAGIPLRFLMQVDVQAHRLPDFIDLARRAGCFQVFIGMESLNPASLADAGKRQNRVSDYATMIAAWRAAGILTHVGYIIGFPSDGPESVRDDVRALRDEVSPDIASFFMLTPLPGSADYVAIARDPSRRLDDDLNRYDTFHPVVDHPRMSGDTWHGLYRQAWRDFYTVAHMRRRLASHTGTARVTLLQMYLWYRSAVAVDDYHPMMTGFVRLKPRRDRRAGSAVDPPLRHLARRLPELYRMGAGYAAVLRELRELWIDPAGSADAPRPASRLQSARLWRDFLAAMFGSAAQGPDPVAPRRDGRTGDSTAG